MINILREVKFFVWWLLYIALEGERERGMIKELKRLTALAEDEFKNVIHLIAFKFL